MIVGKINFKERATHPFIAKQQNYNVIFGLTGSGILNDICILSRNVV